MEPIDFSQPSRQSSKGILVIFALHTLKFIRRYFVVFLALGLSVIKEESFSFLTPSILTLIITGVVLLILLFAILKYLNFKFYLDKDQFHLSSGIVNKNLTIVPKSKIQNVYIKQNLIQQLINVVSLTIETAGDDKAEIEINALNRANALELKKQLFVKKQIAAADSVEDISESSVYFMVSTKRLLLEGISQNHLKSFVIIVSFVFGLYNEFKDYLQDLGISEQLQSSVNFETGSLFNLILANAFIVVLAILISTLFSIISTFISNFNLKVIENNITIEINKGLFNKLSLILMPVRIQNIIIKTNRLKQALGLHTLSIKQAMVNKKQQKNFKIVALEQHQVAHLVTKVFPLYNGLGPFDKPDVYYKRRLIFRSIIWGLFVNGLALVIFGNFFWSINSIIVPWLALFVHYTYKKSSYQITDKYLTVNSGFIDRVRNISEIEKIQSVQIKQSIFQKQNNIASVHIATASDKVKIPCITEKNAKSIVDYLLFKIES
ncbi:PH domain-containing protein [Gelidibacter maritimus]|uniref:PH domain-containing protein n=1 Tax=Gelidibacter maritimus TaxID=2761487 RepID=A0A7W2M7P1_9FLAO|nr:PH domain-containing protein [Gelidibacter maritimus]MBA6154178.1 PH domain-containing protein [Gelidibacter maritimus]